MTKPRTTWTHRISKKLLHSQHKCSISICTKTHYNWDLCLSATHRVFVLMLLSRCLWCLCFCGCCLLLGATALLDSFVCWLAVSSVQETGRRGCVYCMQYTSLLRVQFLCIFEPKAIRGVFWSNGIQRDENANECGNECERIERTLNTCEKKKQQKTHLR